MNVSMFRVTLASWASEVRALVVQLQGPGARPIPGDAVEAWQPMGLRAHPVIRSTTEALVIELPNGERIAFKIDKGRDEGGVEAEAGETQLHGLSAQSAVVRIRANGDVEISPATGRNLVLAGGTLDAARATDPVTADAVLAAWIGLVTAAVNVLAPGAITPAQVPGATIGTITSGNPRVKA